MGGVQLRFKSPSHNAFLSLQPFVLWHWQVLNWLVPQSIRRNLLLNFDLWSSFTHVGHDRVGIGRLNEKVILLFLEKAVKEQFLLVQFVGLSNKFHDLVVRLLQLVQIGSDVSFLLVADRDCTEALFVENQLNNVKIVLLFVLVRIAAWEKGLV